MKQWKNHTPDGVFDLLENECARKKSVEDAIGQVYHSAGYFQVQTPILEFYDVFAQGSTQEQTTDFMKLLDRRGRILVLRPDLTTPCARIFASKYTDVPMPKRVSYVGSAFRNGDSVSGVVQKEFTQTGIELVGLSSAEADAEVIAITIRALLAAGLEKLQIDLGQAEFFKGLMEEAGLEERQIERLRRLIDSKSELSSEELSGRYGINPELSQVILSLPGLFGGIELVGKIRQKRIGDRAARALDNLLEIYEILKDYGYEKYISVDLGMVQAQNYYTGVMIKGFVHGIGFPVCGGGRYDNLIGTFGASLPATGVAIGIERLLSALSYEKAVFDPLQVHTLVCFTGHRKTALQVAAGLRMSGLCVELWLGGSTSPEDYARARGIGGIVRVADDDTLDIINLQDMEITRTSISALLGDDEA